MSYIKKNGRDRPVYANNLLIISVYVYINFNYAWYGQLDNEYFLFKYALTSFYKCWPNSEIFLFRVFVAAQVLLVNSNMTRVQPQPSCWGTILNPGCTQLEADFDLPGRVVVLFLDQSSHVDESWSNPVGLLCCTWLWLAARLKEYRYSTSLQAELRSSKPGNMPCVPIYPEYILQSMLISNDK